MSRTNSPRSVIRVSSDAPSPCASVAPNVKAIVRTARRSFFMGATIKRMKVRRHSSKKLHGREGLIHIRDQVLDVFDADRNPHQPRRDAESRSGVERDG